MVVLYMAPERKWRCGAAAPGRHFTGTRRVARSAASRPVPARASDGLASLLLQFFQLRQLGSGNPKAWQHRTSGLRPPRRNGLLDVRRVAALRHQAGSHSGPGMQEEGFLEGRRSAARGNHAVVRLLLFIGRRQGELLCALGMDRRANAHNSCPIRVQLLPNALSCSVPSQHECVQRFMVRLRRYLVGTHCVNYCLLREHLLEPLRDVLRLGRGVGREAVVVAASGMRSAGSAAASGPRPGRARPARSARARCPGRRPPPAARSADDRTAAGRRAAARRADLHLPVVPVALARLGRQQRVLRQRLGSTIGFGFNSDGAATTITSSSRKGCA